MLVHGIVHLILYRGEKQFGHLCPWVIVCRCGIDVRHLLIEIPFTATDVTYALQEW